MANLLRRIAWVTGIAAMMPLAPAQVSGVFDMGVLTNTMAQGAIVKSERERSIGMGQGDPLKGKTTVRPNPAALLYKPSATDRKRNIDSFISKAGAGNPAVAAELKKAFATSDIMGEIRRGVRKQGLNPDNVADAMAVYMVAAWYGVRGSIDSKPADFRAVGLQFRTAMALVPAMAKVSNAVKQQTAETLLLQALLTEQAVTGAKKQPESMSGVKSMIAKGATATFGFDLAKLRLGAKGFAV